MGFGVGEATCSPNGGLRRPLLRDWTQTTLDALNTAQDAHACYDKENRRSVAEASRPKPKRDQLVMPVNKNKIDKDRKPKHPLSDLSNFANTRHQRPEVQSSWRSICSAFAYACPLRCMQEQELDVLEELEQGIHTDPAQSTQLSLPLLSLQTFESDNADFIVKLEAFSTKEKPSTTPHPPESAARCLSTPQDEAHARTRTLTCNPEVFPFPPPETTSSSSEKAKKNAKRSSSSSENAKQNAKRSSSSSENAKQNAKRSSSSSENAKQNAKRSSSSSENAKQNAKRSSSSSEKAKENAKRSSSSSENAKQNAKRSNSSSAPETASSSSRDKENTSSSSEKAKRTAKRSSSSSASETTSEKAKQNAKRSSSSSDKENTDSRSSSNKKGDNTAADIASSSARRTSRRDESSRSNKSTRKPVKPPPPLVNKHPHSAPTSPARKTSPPRAPLRPRQDVPTNFASSFAKDLDRKRGEASLHFKFYPHDAESYQLSQHPRVLSELHWMDQNNIVNCLDCETYHFVVDVKLSDEKHIKTLKKVLKQLSVWGTLDPSLRELYALLNPHQQPIWAAGWAPITKENKTTQLELSTSDSGTRNNDEVVDR